MPVATVLVGLGAGAGGIMLTLLLHAVQHVAFGYTENTFLVGVERASNERRVLALLLGGSIVALGWWWHRRRYDAEDVSVTRVLREPATSLSIRAAVADAVLQVVAVGAGASLGREGAPRQTGAALADWITTQLGIRPPGRRTLLACGAGAGLAAVYNVPLAGALFALEVLLSSWALADVLPALGSAVIATIVAWPVLSNHPTYEVPSLHFSWQVLAYSPLCALMAGVAGLAFIRLMDAARHNAPSGLPAIPAIMAGFTVLGAGAIIWPELLGNGKGPAELALTGSLGIGLSAVLLVLKPAATALCLRAGAIGGLLTPALATGACMGAFGGELWGRLWPGASAGACALVGAAALLAVTQRAPVTAVVLPLELIRGGMALLVPVALAVLVASWTARLLESSTPAHPGRRRTTVPSWLDGRREDHQWRRDQRAGARRLAHTAVEAARQVPDG